MGEEAQEGRGGGPWLTPKSDVVPQRVGFGQGQAARRAQQSGAAMISHMGCNAEAESLRLQRDAAEARVETLEKALREVAEGDCGCQLCLDKADRAAVLAGGEAMSEPALSCPVCGFWPRSTNHYCIATISPQPEAASEVFPRADLTHSEVVDRLYELGGYSPQGVEVEQTDAALRAALKKE